jgi:hypothetical protein
MGTILADEMGLGKTAQMVAMPRGLSTLSTLSPARGAADGDSPSVECWHSALQGAIASARTAFPCRQFPAYPQMRNPIEETGQEIGDQLFPEQLPANVALTQGHSFLKSVYIVSSSRNEKSKSVP